MGVRPIPSLSENVFGNDVAWPQDQHHHLFFNFPVGLVGEVGVSAAGLLRRSLPRPPPLNYSSINTFFSPFATKATPPCKQPFEVMFNKNATECRGCNAGIHPVRGRGRSDYSGLG